MCAKRNPSFLSALLLLCVPGLRADPTAHAVSGDVDPTFFFQDHDRLNELPFEEHLGWVSEVRSVLVQPDGKILIGSAEVQTELAWFRKPVRLFPDGSIDPSFETARGGPAFHNELLAVDAQGRVLVSRGSPFALQPPRLGRRVSTGEIDPAFMPPENARGIARIQPDGMIITQLTTDVFGADTEAQVVRLDPDGQIDPTFDASGIFGRREFLTHLALQPDGKILAGAGHVLRRLDTDGLLDPAFANGVSFLDPIVRVLLQSDGKIVVIDTCRVRRLNANGTPDPTFAIGFPDGSAPKELRDGAIDERDRILVCGMFWNFNFENRPSIVRLLPDGAVDPTIFAGTEIPGSEWFGSMPQLNAMARQPDGSIVVASSGNLVIPFPSREHFLPLNEPRGLDVIADGELIATDIDAGNPVLRRVDRGGNILETISLSQNHDPRAVVYHPGRDTYFTSFPDPGMLFEFSPDGQLVGQIDIGIVDLESLALDPNTGRFLVVSNPENVLYEVGTDGSVIGQADLAPLVDDLLAANETADPEGLAFDAAGGRLFVAYDANGLVITFDFTPAAPDANPPAPTLVARASTFSTIALELSGGPDGIAFEASTDRLLLVNSDGGAIAETDLDGNLVRHVETVPPPDPIHPVHMNVMRLYGDRYLPANQIENPRLLPDLQRFQFQAPTFSGIDYLLERNPTLLPLDWEIVDHREGMNAPLIFRDTAATEPQSYYRVRTAFPFVENP